MDKDVKLTALKEILYGAGISFVLGMIGYIIMFFFKLITARHFGPEGLGIFELLMTILGITLVFSGLGLEHSILRFAPEYKAKKQENLLSGFKKFCTTTILIASLIISLIIFLFAQNITNFFNFPAEFTLFLKIVSIGIPIKKISTIFAGFLLAEKKPLNHNLDMKP